MNITNDTTVAAIATNHPLATRVFARHKIDFCCGGKRPVAVICDEKGIDVDALIAEIEAELAATPDGPERWDEASSADLIAHILSDYHEPLKEELPRLEFMARKVNRVHGDKHPEMFDTMLDLFLDIKEDLDTHLVEEEEVLFPAMLAGEFDSASSPMSKIEAEHTALGDKLKALRETTGDFVVPAEACNTWRGLWVGLEELERSLHQHIHLENNILHPRF
jgi:regulator of cell morphogenesis and NO signaling